MAQHPFLKSIRPVNLLSFGPNTEEIELRPLNILIGPNGSGKSNLIEIVGLLSKLPERNPWTKVRETGGAREWIWKGKDASGNQPSVSLITTAAKIDLNIAVFQPIKHEYGSVFYRIDLRERNGSFEIGRERFREIEENEDPGYASLEDFVRDDRIGSPDRSALSMPANAFDPLPYPPRFSELADNLERFAFYRDWVFGSGLAARQPVSAGQPVEALLENTSNLAQLLARYQSDYRPTFDRLNELMQQFYEPIKSVEVRIVSTHLQVAILEEGGFSIPAYRLSDGTLRWLALLAILLNPTPAPVTCIEEPELGLHPDMIPTLSDLLRDASTRTQLILTTHSRTLVECFSDDPESVCVCEKFEGATEIKRLEADYLKVWLEKYSLGQLWSSGEIGGNRW